MDIVFFVTFTSTVFLLTGVKMVFKATGKNIPVYSVVILSSKQLSKNKLAANLSSLNRVNKIVTTFITRNELLSVKRNAI